MLLPDKAAMRALADRVSAITQACAHRDGHLLGIGKALWRTRNLQVRFDCKLPVDPCSAISTAESWHAADSVQSLNLCPPAGHFARRTCARVLLRYCAEARQILCLFRSGPKVTLRPGPAKFLALSAAVPAPPRSGRNLRHGEVAIRSHRDLVHWEETMVGCPEERNRSAWVRQLRPQATR